MGSDDFTPGMSPWRGVLRQKELKMKKALFSALVQSGDQLSIQTNHISMLTTVKIQIEQIQRTLSPQIQIQRTLSPSSEKERKFKKILQQAGKQSSCSTADVLAVSLDGGSFA